MPCKNRLKNACESYSIKIIRLKIDIRYILTQPTFLTQLSTIASKANTSSQSAKLSSGNEIFIQKNKINK